jgi:hypothetical protein
MSDGGGRGEVGQRRMTTEMVVDGSRWWRDGGGDGGERWGGGGNINPLLIWFNDKILIPTYFYSVPVQEITQPACNLLATC